MKNKNNIDDLINLIITDVNVEHVANYCDDLDLDQAGENGRTPLMVASAAGRLEVVKVLLKKGANPQACGFRLMTPIHEACSNGQVEVAKCLIDLRAELNSVSSDGLTPLMCAAAWGYTNVVQLLLNKGANKLMKDNLGATAIDIAREKGEHTLADFIDKFHL